MGSFPKDLSTLSLEDLLSAQAVNRAAIKEIRLQKGALVDTRLAKQISAEEYADRRKVATEQEDIYGRHARNLIDELALRQSRLR